jgi:hypothetical protein
MWLELEERGERLMSRWNIEKDGTGIEKAGTGIEKSGTGIEKSGTGIEKSGTGIEKSGTGIRRGLIACTLAVLTFTGSVQAGTVDPEGSLQVVVHDNNVAVSWIIGDSVFSGVSTLNGSYANLMLTEVTLGSPRYGVTITGNGTGSSKEITGNGTGSSKEITGNGTGSSKEITGNGTGSGKEITGNGTGSSKEITGNGTGSSIEITGNGTGSSTEITGNGTGSSTEITGNGTGSNTEITGNGTGSNTEITGNGTGSTILITGNGTGTEALRVTLPNGTGMNMEVRLACGTAGVSVIDDLSVSVVEFKNVPVIGKTGFCGNNNSREFGADFRANPGRDFRSGK